MGAKGLLAATGDGGGAGRGAGLGCGATACGRYESPFLDAIKGAALSISFSVWKRAFGSPNRSFK